MIKSFAIVMATATAAAAQSVPEPAVIGPQPPIGPEEKVVEVEPDEQPAEEVRVEAPRWIRPRVDRRYLAQAAAPTSPHLNVGGEVAGDATSISYVMRLHGGISYALGRGMLRPTIGIGGTFGAGTLGADDVRALDGTVDLRYIDYGPEVQLGMRWISGGRIDTRLFASFAYLRTELDERLMIDSIEGIGGTHGKRAAIGINWADTLGRSVRDSTSRDATWILFVLPTQVELTWLDSGGTRRVGLTASYGI